MSKNITSLIGKILDGFELKICTEVVRIVRTDGVPEETLMITTDRLSAEVFASGVRESICRDILVLTDRTDFFIISRHPENMTSIQVQCDDTTKKLALAQLLTKLSDQEKDLLRRDFGAQA